MNAVRIKPTTAQWLAWAFWVLLFIGICADVLHRPMKHTTMPTYRDAATDWWQGQDPYTYNHHSGFLYFPQAAIVFTPFNVLPFYAGEIVWRIATFGIFFYALSRLNAFFVARGNFSPLKSFLILSLLAVPGSLASLRNAQYDLPLAALVILTAAELASARWNVATLWLCLGIMLKPLAVVPLLLYGAVYGKHLIPRLAVGLLIVALIPFLHWSPSFVAHEYYRCVETLIWASKGDEPRYSELAALLSHVGIFPPEWLKVSARIVFALVYLGLGLAAVRRLNPVAAAWAVGALSTDYLMLFNPRTETCSFVFLGPWVASLAIVYARQPSREWLGYLLGFAALGFACDAIPVVHGWTDRWYKPLLALLFLPVLIEFILGRSRENRTP